MSDRYGTINVYIKHMTGSSVLIDDSDKGEMWLPLSMIETNIDECDVGSIIDIDVEEWLLIEKELI